MAEALQNDADGALSDAVASLSLSAPAGADSHGLHGFDGCNDALDALTSSRDLGVYVWRPGEPKCGDYKSQSEVKAAEIFSRLDVSPLAMADVPKLVQPLAQTHSTTFERAATQQPHVNKFPNDGGVAASLAAAAALGVGFGAVDFVFGGSTLHVLAERSTNRNIYLVQRAGTAIAIGKHSEYTGDLGARGFQFERLVTGEAIDARASHDATVGLQLATVGPHSVLFQAEVDALNAASGARVEIKSGNPNRFGAKEMYQMVSSRSTELVYAECRGDVLVKVHKVPLREVASWVPQHVRSRYQKNILQAMQELKDMLKQIPEDASLRLEFTREGAVRLGPTEPGEHLLPAPEVIKTLLDPVGSGAVVH